MESSSSTQRKTSDYEGQTWGKSCRMQDFSSLNKEVAVQLNRVSFVEEKVTISIF